jgi:hypothetical protein
MYPGEIAGVVIGCILAATLIAIITTIACLYYREKRHNYHTHVIGVNNVAPIAGGGMAASVNANDNLYGSF